MTPTRPHPTVSAERILDAAVLHEAARILAVTLPWPVGGVVAAGVRWWAARVERAG